MSDYEAIATRLAEALRATLAELVVVDDRLKMEFALSAAEWAGRPDSEPEALAALAAYDEARRAS